MNDFITLHAEAFAAYLAIVNGSGFLLLLLNTKIKAPSIARWINVAAAVCAVAGGALGAILALALFDRKATKENMMSRVVIVVFAVLQLLFLLWIFLFREKPLSIHLIRYFQDHPLLGIYILIMSLITFVLFGVDKRAAIKEKKRISIVTLLGFSFFGGSLGGLAAMYLFRHKTKKNYFSVGLPLIIVMQLCLLIFISNL